MYKEELNEKNKSDKKNIRETARVAISLLRGERHVADFEDDELATQLQNTTMYEFLNNKISVQFEMEVDKVPKVWSDKQQIEINNIHTTLALHSQILEQHTNQIGLILTTVQEMQKQIQQVQSQQQEMQKQQQEMQKQIVVLSTKVDKMSDKLDNLADKFDQHLKNHK